MAEFKRAVAVRIRLLRKSSNHSVGEMQKRIPGYRAIERGHKPTNPNIERRLASYFECHLRDIRGPY